jgi:aspartyl-tRNA(Asn)/glutamyl-tRNA(Gln) amidotransferase subunit A
MTGVADFTIAEAARALESRSLSAVELLDAVLTRLERTECVVHAYANVDEAGARASAIAADAAIARGEQHGPLHGIPLAVKDVIAVAGLPMEAGSRSMRGYAPQEDAVVVASLRRSGAIIVGKTVTHELAYGQNVPPTRNAWGPARQPGGSSAGSAVATAVGSALAALGTDSGGSIRHPAGLNGVVGLKPTYGTVSTSGVISLSPSLEHVGPITRTVEDCWLVLSSMAAGDLPRSNVAAPASVAAGMTGARIGVLVQLLDKVDPEMRGAFGTALDVLTELGAEQIDVHVPELEIATATGLALTLPEASVAQGRRLRDVPDELEPGTRVMLALGELVPATDYVLAQQTRELVRRGVRRAFEDNKLDVVACPSTPSAAAPATPDIESPMRELAATLDLHMWANVVGLPALTVPCGFSAEQLPLGLQLAARPHHEVELFRIASAYEQSQTWHCARPSLDPSLA